MFVQQRIQQSPRWNPVDVNFVRCRLPDEEHDLLRVCVAHLAAALAHAANRHQPRLEPHTHFIVKGHFRHRVDGVMSRRLSDGRRSN